MCNVDFLVVLTQDNTFCTDMKLPRFTSLVNLGDKRENTDVFFSPQPYFDSTSDTNFVPNPHFSMGQIQEKSW